MAESLGSEDVCDLKCQPCQRDGNLHEAAGMCLDCQEYLCQRCYDVHTVPTPSRSHRLLDNQQMLQSQVPVTVKDRCSEKCEHHDDKTIKYYCTSHSKLGCSVYINLDHRACEGVEYIPLVSKDLVNNEEYQKTASQLKSVLEKSKEICLCSEENAYIIENNYEEALKSVTAYKKEIIEALEKSEAEIVEKLNALKSNKAKNITSLTETWRQIQKEIEETLAKVATLENRGQHCNSYTIMMKTRDMLQAVECQAEEAEQDQSLGGLLVNFTPNPDILNMLQQPNALGILSAGVVVNGKHDQDILVKSEKDKRECYISGSVLLGNSLAITDRYNCNVKVVDLKCCQITAEQIMSSGPWDITATRESQVAVTLPDEKKIVFVTVGNAQIDIDRKLDVDGQCRGVDYRGGKLAISFCEPYKVQVLDLNGVVLHNISTNKQGRAIFDWPGHLAFGRDGTQVYVSNNGSNKVVCIGLDGAVVATYTDSKLLGPRQPTVVSSGEMYVCSQTLHTVLQISPDSKKIQVLLSQADGLNQPNSICYRNVEHKFYVGMQNCNFIKVYKAVFSD